MVNGRLAWMLKTIFISGIIVLLNYPIAFSVCHDITPHFTTLITTLLILSVLYGFSTLCGPHHFHAVLIGLLAGNLIALFTWMASFREIVFGIYDPEKLSVFYSLGIFIPATIHFFLSVKQDESQTKTMHITLTSLGSIGLFFYLLIKLVYRQLHEPQTLNFYHFGMGLLIGSLTALIIHIVMNKNILVFQKLTLYLEVMMKPIIAFFLGYLLIMFTFAGIYTIFYFADHTIFTPIKNDVFGEMLFYSFSTITGMTFSAVEPIQPLSFFLSTAEHFLGLVWMTVVFAAALAHLQLPFKRISLQLESLMKNEIDK